MANMTKGSAVKKTVKTTSNKKKETLKKDIESVNDDIVVEEVKEPVKEVRNFKDTDLIQCLCVFPGSVGMTGKRTKNVYMWEDMGVVEYVEYQDLRSEVLNKKSPYIYKPLIIVEDEDFLEQNPALSEMYKDIYTPEEVVDKIKNLTPEGVKKFVDSLPSGIKGNVKNIAATMIHDGALYDIRKIRILDNIFETDLELCSQLMSEE